MPMYKSVNNLPAAHINLSFKAVINSFRQSIDQWQCTAIQFYPSFTQLDAMLHRPTLYIIPESKVHGANMGPIWGRQDLGGPPLLAR